MAVRCCVDATKKGMDKKNATNRKGFFHQGVQYDAQHAQLVEDIEFYRSLARETGGPILELCCGTGRISIPLAEDGHQVTGIDIEDSMLAVAKRKGANFTEFLKADMRDFHLGRQYPLVMLPFNGKFQLYDADQVSRCFACVKEHMNAGSLFVLGMSNPRMELVDLRPDQVRELPQYTDPVSGQQVQITETANYDKETQIRTATWHYVIGNESFDNQLRLRVHFPGEVDSLLHRSGFIVQQRFGTYDKEPLTSASPRQIYLVTSDDELTGERS